MKRADLCFMLVVIALFLPFFLSETLFQHYSVFNSEHGLVMSFIKFAVLSTMGEMLGLRISKGVYYRKGFGIFPKALVWGILGVGISMAFTLFIGGVMALAASFGVDHPSAIMSGPIGFEKILLAFSISVAMNSIFAPVFMTFHKVTDMHINATGGSLRGFLTPIPMGSLLQQLNWEVQWGFVFKKTIPLFWYPAHTITFLLPEEYRVLFAALLGVALGVILAVAANKQ